MLLLVVNAVAAAVVITPDSPDDNNRLTCDVSGSDATYNYYWYVDGSRVRLETARSSTLAATQTSGGDEVICRAYRPSTPFTPESYVGRDAVTIRYVFTTPGIIVYPWQPQEPANGYPDDGYGEAYIPPTFPDDGYGEEYVPPEYPDDGYGEVYNPSQCNDHRDNDNDGLVDMNDPGCDSPQDDDESNPVIPPAPQCSDNQDNDGDGFVDMNDPGCSSPLDDDEHNDVHNPACSDGIDNDNDGFVDMNDPGCDSPQDDSEVNIIPPNDEEVPEPSEGQARNLNLDMVYATVEEGNLVIDYILENDGTMSVKGVELSVNVPDLDMNHFEDLGKISVGKKVYGKISMKLPENAQGAYLVKVEAIGLGAHDSEQRTFTVESMASANVPNIEVLVFVPEAQVQEKGFFAKIIGWFLSLFRAIF